MHPADKVHVFDFFYTPVSKAADVRSVRVTVRAKDVNSARKKAAGIFKSPSRWRAS